jgi:ATP-dependent DNA helicase RecG
VYVRLGSTNRQAGVSKIRNRVIARVFREMGLMEEWGSGYKRVIHACQSGGYPEPDWEELGTAFRVIFHPHPAVLEYPRADVPINVTENVTENREQSIFNLILTNKYITTTKLAQMLNVNRRTISRDIESLKNEGKLIRVGGAKGGYWDVI